MDLPVGPLADLRPRGRGHAGARSDGALLRRRRRGSGPAHIRVADRGRAGRSGRIDAGRHARSPRGLPAARHQGPGARPRPRRRRPAGAGACDRVGGRRGRARAQSLHHRRRVGASTTSRPGTESTADTRQYLLGRTVPAMPWGMLRRTSSSRQIGRPVAAAPSAARRRARGAAAICGRSPSGSARSTPMPTASRTVEPVLPGYAHDVSRAWRSPPIRPDATARPKRRWSRPSA